MADWPAGSEYRTICTWSSFYHIWNKEFPLLRVKPPSIDTCMDCHVFKNIENFKLNTKRPSVVDRESDSDSHDEELENEAFILRASEHVTAARAQKEFAKKKIELARLDQSITPGLSRKKIITLVMDYCMNLDIPHVGNEQPGDTYYFSPIWLYCLVIVNVGIQRLFYFVYDESQGGKGGNNTASILLYYVKHYIIDPNFIIDTNLLPMKELNLIMDNFLGQNKNRMIIRAGAYMLEMRWFDKINLIFLIKGHKKMIVTGCLIC